MEEQARYIAQIMATMVLSIGGLVVIGLCARILWRLGSGPSRSLPVAEPERLERLEQAVDAIAIEVERISEAQRFAVTLLSDRLPNRADDRLTVTPARGSLPRHDTPTH
jgi:hypothetical protein